MKISAVIPCYNGEKFIADAIDSINQQTRRPDEIVVVDDGSKDATAAILKNLQATNEIPIVIVTQANRGVSVARNVGVAAASGDWIAFLDVDDLWFATMLEEKVKVIEAHNLTNALVCCDYYENEMNESAKKHNKSKLAHQCHDTLYKGIDFQKLILTDNFVGTASVMMFSRQEAISIGGFDALMKHSEDFDFILRLLRKANVFILSAPLALKRHHGGNLTDDKELYYFSHALSCNKNLQYDDKYTRDSFSAEINQLLKKDYDKFIIGYCNEVYEKNASKGLTEYLLRLGNIKTMQGVVSHLVAFAKKLVRTVSLGVIRKQKT